MNIRFLLTLTCIVCLMIVMGIWGLSLFSSASDSSISHIELIDTETAQSDKRIVALLPFAVDQLIEMGITPVAVPLIRGNVPETWDGIPAVSSDHSAGPNIEQIMAAQPDVIISSSVYAQFVPQIESLTGCEVVMMDVDSTQSVIANIKILGDITNRVDEAESLIALTTAALEAAAPIDHQPDVLAIFGTPHAFYAFLPDSYLGDLIEISGGTLITSDMESHPVYQGLAPISMEVVVDRDPELLIAIFHGPEESARAMLERDPLWANISAVKNDNLVFLQDDLYAMRPGSEFKKAYHDIRSILAQAKNLKP